MVAVPLVIPDTTPLDGATEAMALLLELQVPPEGVVALVNVTDAPAHTVSGPDELKITPGAETIILKLELVVPHVLVSVYLSVAPPPATPVTTPELEIVAVLVDKLDQVPPLRVLTSVVVEPRQIFEAPLITPA